MASRPIYPHSVYLHGGGNIFEALHIGAGGGLSVYDRGIGIVNALGADAHAHLRFDVPDPLPAGTLKLRLRALASKVASGTENAKVNPTWAAVANGDDPSSTALSAEGITTVTWTFTGDNDKYKTTEVTLDAATAPAAGEIIIMDLHFESTDWTVLVDTLWQPSIFWD